MNNKKWWTRIIICTVTLLMVIQASGIVQAQEGIKSFFFSGGTQKTILTYGLHSALSQAGRINIDSFGNFSVSVPLSTTEVPTKYPPPFSVEVRDLRMQGTWNDKDAQGTFTLTSTIISNRTDRTDLADPMGNDEWYYLATYNYNDAVTASGTIIQEANNLVFTVDAVVNRTGNSRLVNVIVNNGQTTTGDNPTITDKSGSFRETARYNFIISETGDSTPSIPPVGTLRPTATQCPADTEEKKLAEILKLYTARIPKGITSSGKTNNIWDALGYPGYAEFTCGGYQSKVLDFLNGLKFSKDPCVKQLLDNWDYGPIQAWFGYHQAVALYPKGTDWKSAGIVLDPWPDQTPKTYSANDWAIMFSSNSLSTTGTLSEELFGATFIGIGASEVYRDGKAYPIVGGDYKDASNEDLNVRFTEEDYKIIQSLSPEKRATFNKLPKPEQKRWLQVVTQGGEKTQKTIAHCPLNLSIKDANGKRSGISGTEILTELPDVQFMILKLVDGTNYTEITYPENAGYTLVLEGTDEGQAHVFQGHTLLLGETTPPLQQYNFTAKKGETYQIATNGLGAPMQWEGGSLEPESVTEISAEFLENLPKLFSPGLQLTDDSQTENESTGESGFLNWRPPLWLAILVLLIGLFLFTIALILLIINIRKRKKQDALTAEKSAKKGINPAFWVVIIALVIISCFISGFGVIGLISNITNLSSTNPDNELEQTITAINFTEMALATQFAQNPTNQGISLSATLTVVDEPSSQPAIIATPLSSDTQFPSATDTMTITPAATETNQSGNQVLDDTRIVDDFSSKLLGWPEVDDGSKILKYENGGYSFQLLEKDAFDVVYLPVSFNPSEISFTVKGYEGIDDGTFGVFCHFQDQNNYYYVEFDMLTKSYVIAQSLDGEYVPLTAITDEGQYWHDAEPFIDITEENKISIGCYLGNIFVSVNDVLVDNVSVANPFLEKGQTALFVYTYPFAGEEGYKVLFDNLEVYDPQQ